MAIPAWALLLGGAKLAPEVANDWMTLGSNINTMRSGSNADDAAALLQKFKTSKDAMSYDPTTEGYMTRQDRKDILAERDARVKALQETEAAPLQSVLSRYAANGWGTDPSFTPGEWATGIADLEGAKIDPTNPVQVKTLQDFTARAGSLRDMQQNFEGVQTGKFDPATMARVALDPNAQATHSAASNVLNAFKEGVSLAEKEKAREDMGQISRMAYDLLQPDMSGANKGKTPNAAAVQADVGALLDAYRNAPVAEANKLRDDINKQMKESFDYNRPMSVGTGRSKEVYFPNTYGLAPQKMVKDVAPITNIHNNNGGGKAEPGGEFQYFWTQNDPNAPPMLEKVKIGSPTYDRYMYGDLAQTGRVKPFGKKGQMTSGQANSSFKYSPQDKVSGVDNSGNKTTGTKAKTVAVDNAPAVSVVRDKNGKLVVQR